MGICTKLDVFKKGANIKITKWRKREKNKVRGLVNFKRKRRPTCWATKKALGKWRDEKELISSKIDWKVIDVKEVKRIGSIEAKVGDWKKQKEDKELWKFTEIKNKRQVYIRKEVNKILTKMYWT